MHLLEVLREECGIVSAKNGCAPEGACGCCLVDDRRHARALSCLRKPEQMEGHDVTTLEGLPEDTRRAIGEAFVLEGGVQCGFCIPGIVVRAASLIEQGKTDDRDADRKGARRPYLPLHRLRPNHRCDPDSRRGGGERRQLPRTEPRRHSFFGEEFGLHRNPAFEYANGTKVTASASRTRASVARTDARRASRSSTTCACLECCTARWC